MKKLLLVYFLLSLFLTDDFAQSLNNNINSDLAVQSMTVYPVFNTNVQRREMNLCLTVANHNSNKLKVNFYGRKKIVSTDKTNLSSAHTDLATTSTGQFTIILLPDTQYYTAEPQGTNGGSNAIFKRQIKWIVNNRATRNIVYVAHVGDCSQHGDQYEVEWKRSDTALRLLENPTLTGLAEGIPYGVCVGNHDQTPKGDFAGTTSFYNKYFGTSRFKSRSYYGGHYGTDNNNFYDTFTVGNVKFLVIYFEFNTSTSNFTAAGGPLDWGESLVKKYPNHNVIVISHYVLTAAGSFNNQGYSIFQRFKIYPNFKLMLGGHVPDSAAEAVKLNTYNGNNIYTVLSNYQGRKNGGNGLLRMYEFDPANNNVAVKTFSPYTGTYEKDANSQFNMNIKLITSSALNSSNNFQLITQLNNIPTGTNPCASWSSLDENSNYEWYAEVVDGEKKITTPISSFTTGNSLKKSEQLPESKEVFSIYPNPNSSNNLTLYFTSEITGEARVEIFNITGKLLIEKDIRTAGNTAQIEHNLPNGTYIVVVRTGTVTAQKKLVVAK